MRTFTELYLQGLQQGITKRAAAEAPAGYFGMAQQQYMPQYQRRNNLEGSEEDLIAQGQKRIIPKIFKSDADSPTVDMQDPRWAAGFTGTAGAALGGVGGGILGGLIGEGKYDNAEGGMRAGAAIGAVTTGLVGALLGYHGRSAENNTLVEAMRRLPVGGTRRDMKADPVYQAEQDRKTQIAAASLMAGGVAGRR